MKVQKSKVAGLNATRFELKRMELLRYHNTPVTGSNSGIASIWLMILMATLFVPASFRKKGSEPGKEKE